MLEEEEEEELDDETAQALVDASLAKIYSVTSTWLKPKKTPSVPKKDFGKELEEIMRRPPRLGVGAELPEKQAGSGPGELKLKNKMLGKKRGREETDSRDTVANPTSEDDEEDSKSRVIQKKPRLDPFASSKKKGKGLNLPTTIPPPKLAGSPSALETNPVKDEVIPGIRSPVNTPNVASTSEPTRGAGADEADQKAEEKQSISGDVTATPNPMPSLPPVLNLHGPPAMQNDAESSPKRKRRKRKKKKRHAGEGTGAAPQASTG